MTAKQNYQNLKRFLGSFPKYIETKKDLLKLKDKKLLLEYYVYRKYFNINRNYKPETVIRELKKYKETNIKFVSEELGLNLEKNPNFNDKDKYKLSSKLIAKVVKAMLNQDLKLNSIDSEYRTFDIAYKRTANRKVVTYALQQSGYIEFMNELPDDVYINITKANGGYSSSYNKNGLDFIYDYHNSSNDFAQNLAPMVEDVNIFIYKF